MAKQSFLPRTDAGKLAWLKNFSSKLPAYAAKYGISPDEVNDTLLGALVLAFWLDYLNQQTQYMHKVAQYKQELMKGTAAGAAAPMAPVAPVMNGVPGTVLPDIIGRATSIGVRIKKHKDYSVSDGTDLDLEGAEIDVAPENEKPLITLSLVSGGHVNIDWAKGNMDGIDIYKDGGDGIFTFLAVDTFPGYIDNSTLPAAGQSALWRYKAIYRYHDEQVGEWSDVVSITVMGGV